MATTSATGELCLMVTELADEAEFDPDPSLVVVAPPVLTAVPAVAAPVAVDFPVGWAVIDEVANPGLVPMFIFP